MITDALLLVVAGLLAGALNAVAGGGSFFTLPALVALGLPPLMANASGTAALLPGDMASAWRFRGDIRMPGDLSLWGLLLLVLVGAVSGALLLLLSSEQLFSTLVPWLMLLASVIFALSPRLLKNRATAPTWLAALTLLLVCAYGGYFNGGVGIVLLAAFGLLGQHDLHGMNGLKNAVSALLTLVAVGVYAAAGLLVWKPLLLMALAALMGGYVGAALAYRLPAGPLRAFIVASGLVMAAVFFLR